MPPMNGHVPEHRVATVAAPDPVGLQGEIIPLLMSIFHPRPGTPRIDQEELFVRLEYYCHHFHDTLRHDLNVHYDVSIHVLDAWIKERRLMARLSQIASNDGHLALRGQERVDWLLAMNDLRVMRVKWKATKTQDGGNVLSSEDLLCKILAAMGGTAGTDQLLKEGLDNLNDSLFEWLRTEDMKINMGGMGSRRV